MPFDMRATMRRSRIFLYGNSLIEKTSVCFKKMPCDNEFFSEIVLFYWNISISEGNGDHSKACACSDVKLFLPALSRLGLNLSCQVGGIRLPLPV